MSSQPVPPRQTNNAIWWILGIVGAGIVLLILAVAAVTGLFIRRVSIQNAGDKVEIQTPAGAIRVNKNEWHSSGLPVYPGAKPSADHGGSVELSAGDDASVGLAEEEYTTSDRFEKVRDWYRHRLGSEFRLETEKGETATAKKERIRMGESELAFVDDRGDGARIVALNHDGGGTKIKLLRVGKREAQ